MVFLLISSAKSLLLSNVLFHLHEIVIFAICFFFPLVYIYSHSIEGLLHCTGDRNQDHPHGKEMQKSKWLSGEALQIAVKKREAKSKGENKRYKHLNAEFQTIARRDKKAFLSDQCKEIEENNRMGKTL